MKSFPLQLELKVIEMRWLHVTRQHVLGTRVRLGLEGVLRSHHRGEQLVVLGVVRHLLGAGVQMQTGVHGLVGLDFGG